MENAALVAAPLSRAEQLAEWKRARDEKKAATGKDKATPRSVLADVTNKEKRGEKRVVREVEKPKSAKKLKPRTVTIPARTAPKTPRRKLVRKPEPARVKPRLQPKFAASSIAPELAMRLKALAKTRPEARTEVWKSKVEVLMAVENLHGSAAFWIVRSQYAETVLSKKKPEHVKAMVTPVVLGLDGQAQPRSMLMERAQGLIQQLFSKYKSVKGSPQMAGSLQHALRKAWRPEMVERMARTPAKTPAKTPRAEAETYLIVDGSPEDVSMDGSIEDLYTTDWTAPEDVSPAIVAEHRAALEQAVEQQNPAALAQAIHDAEEKAILFPQVDLAKKVLVEAMLSTRVADESEVYDEAESEM